MRFVPHARSEIEGKFVIWGDGKVYGRRFRVYAGGGGYFYGPIFPRRERLESVKE